MVVLSPRPTVFIDVDDTLIMWNRFGAEPNADIEIEITCDGRKSYSKVNNHNVHLLVELKRKGHNIVVWSAGGVTWAEAVVRALQLQDFVDVVTSKPHIYIDDYKDPINWMGKHQYMNLDGTAGEFNGKA